ncbi:hypothetical protein imdm_2094 [gamma proteobacterium IMCC2047]|nr:hypothetical protein imdm_2094 [gamma proteobacterium IMCC2047]
MLAGNFIVERLWFSSAEVCLVTKRVVCRQPFFMAQFL